MNAPPRPAVRRDRDRVEARHGDARPDLVPRKVCFKRRTQAQDPGGADLSGAGAFETFLGGDGS
jgi:hypothetical protein